MPTLNHDQTLAKLSQLIETYRTLSHRELQSEANVRANFIDPLFALLGWPINNPTLYNREEFVRGTGFADIALKVNPQAENPLIYVEAKRFGAIDPLDRVQEKRNRAVARLRLQLPGMSVDRTREEQQAINYAYQKGMRWAVLTNFERLRLFNARRDTLVLSFDSPQELLERFDELWQLAFSEVQQGSLEGLRAHRERLDIDEEYLRLINVWRVRLGEDLLAHRENQILLADPVTREIDIYKLRDAVQRILDRLVIIRYAEDRLVIKADQLRSLVEIRERTDYGIPLLDQIRYFFQEFNVRHNGALFAEHLCDRLTVSDDVLHAIITNLYDARFRAMSADIMGNTYEQYLGQTLTIKHGEVQAVDNLETRKAQGSYYTPEHIVQYIVDQTLGQYLYGTDNGRADGSPISGQKRKRVDEIDGSDGAPPLTILDPACGSGSFLINAYHVLDNFYETEIKRIYQEREKRFQELSAQGLPSFDIQLELVGYKQQLERLADYKNQIIERHLYGLDLDPQAAELAAVNLMLRAMTRDMRLPLILNQNIKVGNALLSGLPVYNEEAQPLLTPFAEQLAELRRLRLAQQGIAQEQQHPLALQGQFERLAFELNGTLNDRLKGYFGGDLTHKRPFNWPVEFPEIFLNEQGQLRPDGGFTIIFGNPPYLSIDDTWGSNSPEANYLQETFTDIWAGKSDIYYYFIRRGLSLLMPTGQLGFITARYYLEAYYARNLRHIILQEAALRQLVDFADYTVFPRVGTKAAITLLRKENDLAERMGNQLLCDKVAHRRVDIQAFLNGFKATAYSFQQADLDEDSWHLYGERIGELIAKIDRDTQPLGDLVFIGQGMQTGRNSVFVLTQETAARHQIEPELLRKNIKNQDVDRYDFSFRGLYLLYPEEIDNLDNYPNAQAYLTAHRAELEERAAFKRGDCDWWRFTWPLHKERYHAPKIITPYIAPENRFGLDETGEYIGLTDTTAIFATEQSPDLRYILALLNSRLLTFRYRYIGKAKDYRYEYFENGLKKIPIRIAPPALSEEIVTLAQKMLDLNVARQMLYERFQAELKATIHAKRNFYDAYYAHSEYRNVSIFRLTTAVANHKGTVTNITINEVGHHLIIHIHEEEAGDSHLLTLEIPDEPLRHFLLLSLRLDLLTKERKQVWSRGHLLKGTLKALTLPVLDETSASANIQRIHQFMNQLQQDISTKRKGSAEVLAPLNLSQLEQALQENDQKIESLVCQLYGLSAEDIALM